jgi:hypothetical protein
MNSRKHEDHNMMVTNKDKNLMEENDNMMDEYTYTKEQALQYEG